jgi:DNA-binding MarR family transcriptional regulator
LERKGVLLRHRRPEAPTELRIDLTGKGERLLARAQEVKEAAERRFDEDFSALTGVEREGVARFLRRLVGR